MKVLIVDDIQDNRVLLRGILESRNYNVEEAENGVRALALAQAEPPDLIVSDILMPEMDGFVLCRVVKGIVRLRHIPLVFYTATYLDKEDEELGLALGAARYIHKPVDPIEILRLLKYLLRCRWSMLSSQLSKKQLNFAMVIKVKHLEYLE